MSLIRDDPNKITSRAWKTVVFSWGSLVSDDFLVSDGSFSRYFQVFLGGGMGAGLWDARYRCRWVSPRRLRPRACVTYMFVAYMCVVCSLTRCE